MRLAVHFKTGQKNLYIINISLVLNSRDRCEKMVTEFSRLITCLKISIICLKWISNTVISLHCY